MVLQGPEFLITRSFLLHVSTLMLLPGNLYKICARSLFAAWIPYNNYNYMGSHQRKGTVTEILVRRNIWSAGWRNPGGGGGGGGGGVPHERVHISMPMHALIRVTKLLLQTERAQYSISWKGEI